MAFDSFYETGLMRGILLEFTKDENLLVALWQFSQQGPRDMRERRGVAQANRSEDVKATVSTVADRTAVSAATVKANRA